MPKTGRKEAACRIERSRVVAHRVAGACSPITSSKKVRYGRQGLRAGPWQSGHEWTPKQRRQERNLRPDAATVRGDAPAPWGSAWRKGPARAATRPRARRRARRGPGHGQHGALLHARGCARGRRGQPFKSLLFPKKRKTVPLQVQFLYTNVHKLSGT